MSENLSHLTSNFALIMSDMLFGGRLLPWEKIQKILALKI